MTIEFQNTIALGTVIHLAVLLLFIYGLMRTAFKRFDRIEGKQDKLLGLQKKK